MEPNISNVDLLTTDQLREKVERAWIQHIKLCQDNFLYFVKEMWPDFIFRKETDRTRWGHHQIIANEFTKIASEKKGRLIINMPLGILNLSSLLFTFLLGLLVSILK
jgi:hypothetical protein